MLEKSTIEDNDLINSVILFGAPWCNPCTTLKPLLNELSGNYPELQFVYVDLDKAPGEVIQEFRVMSVPTVKLFINGEEKANFTGLKPRSTYEEAFNLYHA